MGGKALKTINTVRLSSSDYFELERDVLDRLSCVFPGNRVDTVPAYRSKESFGDLDVLLEDVSLPDDWIESVRLVFSPSEMVMQENGSVLSFDVNRFQVDLVLTPKQYYEFALSYYSWNDLGNLIGRLAKGMGYTFGHEGLSYKLYSDGIFIDTISLPATFDQALVFLGLDPVRHKQGFDTPDDIFKYLISSIYFRDQSFLSEDLNHVARVRIKKRPMYAAFLAFLEKNPCQALERNNDLHLKRGFNVFHGFQEQCIKAERIHKEHVIIKGRFNGKIVSELTGLNRLELSDFMLKVKEGFASKLEFDKFILDNDQDDINKHIEMIFSQCAVSTDCLSSCSL